MQVEQEPWAVALWVEKAHGREGPDHIAEQLTRLARAGDVRGVAKWIQIVERYDALLIRPGLPS